MRTTFAAEPRSFDWHFGLFPPISWQRITASGAIKWCDGVLLTWASKDESCERPATNDANVVGFLAERLGHGS
jgi:hypothetical protein